MAENNCSYILRRVGSSSLYSQPPPPTISPVFSVHHTFKMATLEPEYMDSYNYVVRFPYCIVSAASIFYLFNKQ